MDQICIASLYYFCYFIIMIPWCEYYVTTLTIILLFIPNIDAINVYLHACVIYSENCVFSVFCLYSSGTLDTR
jgi:hypothetical protein